MNPEKFQSNLVENKEQAHAEAIAFSDEVKKETEKTLRERGIETLTPSEYEKTTDEVEREIIRKKLEADPSLNEIRDEAVRKIENAGEEMEGMLKEAGASESDIDTSRRKFLKYFGLGVAAVATGAMLGKATKAEAGELTQKAEEVERSMLAFEAEIETNTGMIGVLAMLSEEDIQKINSGSVGKEITKIENNNKLTRYKLGAVMTPSVLLGAAIATGTPRGGKLQNAYLGAILGGALTVPFSPLLWVAGKKVGQAVENIQEEDKTIGQRVIKAHKYFEERHLKSGQMEIPPITMEEVKHEISRLNDGNKELRQKMLKIRHAFRDL